MAECQFIKKREPSKKQDQFPILSWSMISQESEELELEEVTINSEPSDLSKVISTGPLKQSLEKPELLMSFIMHQTMNWSEPKL